MKREVGLEEYKDIILYVLLKVDAICRENGLKYSLFYGTLLGAVRHKGYIPWDDDIDIIMPIEDFDKLADIIREKDYGLNFISPEDNEDTCFPFGKVCNTSTSIVETNLGEIKGYGAFIDIFPFYKVPVGKKWNNPAKYKLLRRLASYAKLKKYRKTGDFKKNMGRLLEFAISRILDPRRLALRIMRDGRKANNLVDTNKLDFFYGELYESVRFPKEIFENQQEVEFEGYSMFGTSNPHENLSLWFGDYMKLPPEEQRIPHHNIVCYIEE